MHRIYKVLLAAILCGFCVGIVQATSDFNTALNATGPNIAGGTLDAFAKMSDGITSVRAAYSNAKSEWSLGYNFSSTKHIDKIRWFSFRSLGRNKNFHIQKSEDGVTWSNVTITGVLNQSTQLNTIDAQASDADGWNGVTFEVTPGKYWRIVFTTFWDGGDVNCGLSEVEIYELPVTAPVASFTPIGVVTGVSPFTTSFNDTSINTPTSWAWGANNVTGNNTWIPIGTNKNQTVTLGGGNWSINVTVSNLAGSSTSTQTTFVNVTWPFTASFSATPTSGLNPLTVSFNDTTTSGYTILYYNASLGDGTWINQTSFPPTNISHTYYVADTYTVNWYVTNIVETVSASPINITVSQNIIANFIPVPSAGPVPLAVAFNDTSTNATALIDSWYWIFGDQGVGNTSILRNTSHTYTAPGVYSANLTIRNSTYGITSTKLLNITANASMAANFTGTPLGGGIPLNVSFTDESSGSITDWLWTFGDGNTSSLQNPTHIYVSSGSYAVDLNITGPDGTTNLTKNAYIVTTDAPTANWTADKYYGLAPLLVTFTDSSMGAGISWNWDFGDGNTSALQNPNHTFVFNGEFQVNLTVTNGFGSSSKLRNITVTDLVSSYSGYPAAGPYPLEVAFTETSTGLIPDSYYYDFGDGNTSALQNPTHTFPHMGYYTISNRITNGTYEFWNNKTNYIEAYGITPSFSVSNATSTNNAPLVVAFTDTSTTLNATIDSYLWVFGDGTQSTDAAPVHVYDTTFGTFYANMTVADSSKGISYTSPPTTLTRIPSNLVSNISYNFVMNQIFPTTIMVKDSQTLALIGGVKVSDNSGNTYTLDNGILSTYYEYGPHTFTFQADGYSTKTTSLFVVGNSSFTVYMDATTGSTFNIYSQKQVGISVVRYNPAGQKVIGAPISLSAISSTLQADSQLQTLYGLNPTAANQMMNGTLLMNGVTGGDGASAFTVLSSIRYQVNVTDPVDLKVYTTTINPAQDPYTVWIGTNPIAVQNTSYSTTNNTALYATQPNSSYVTLNLRYQDLSGSTSNVIFYVVAANNMTTIYSVDLGNPGTGVVYANHTHKNTRGNGYYYYYNATRGA